MRRRALIAALSLVPVACTLSGLDGLTDGVTPAEGGADGAIDAAPTDDASSTDAPLEAADGDAAPIGCQGAVVCERVVFVTQARFATADFRSLAGADMLCDRAATGPSAIARVRGRTYRAWLSTMAASADSRLVHGAARYVRADTSSQTLANDWSGLVSGTLALNIDVDETGQDVPASEVAWTGTHPDGTSDELSCAGWTSSAPGDLAAAGRANWVDADAGGGVWTDGADTPCDQLAHLYCIEY